MLKFKKFVWILSTVIILCIGTWYMRGKGSLEAKLDAYMQAYVEQNKFSGSVLVAKGGKILLCKGYGMANYEHDVVNTPQTIFRLGSITKQFTAMVIMQFQEKKLLRVSDTLNKYISDYPQGDKVRPHPQSGWLDGM